ncbi:hypothetical protein HXY33_06920 [Candidatus Bathyarchaeota archaeon]|nr:hypothetical protein [Candidatus Bathyarchaeota archaeon]
MYITWIKIDETLPWIELKGEHATKREAKKAAEKALKSARIKITKLSEKKEHVKMLVVARTRR